MRIKKVSQSSGVVANVVDNFLSTSTTDALSAGMGKSLKDQLDAKITGWTNVTITGTMTGGTITTQIGGENIDLRNYKLVNVRFRAIENTYHRMPVVLRFDGANNYLLLSYGNLIHYVSIASITNGSFNLSISAFGGATVTIQLAAISVAN